MSDITGITNLNSSSAGDTSLTGIKAAVTNLNTDKQEKGSGTTGNLAAFGASNVLADTGKVAPAGAIVGTSDTQTLTNKTLTSPTVNTPTITSPSTSGTDSGTETLQNKTILDSANTIKIGGLPVTGSGIASGQVLGSNGSNIVPVTVATPKFGGTGTDGALSITSGTTTIDCANAAVVTKNYTSISITGTGVLAFSNPHTNGTIVILKSQGAVTLTSSGAPMINMSGMGAAGGTGNTNIAGNPGSVPNGTFYTSAMVGGAGGAQAGSSGAAGVAPFSSTVNMGKYGNVLIVGAGGGGGGGDAGGGHAGQTGGRGGGGLILECNGAFNFTTSSGISIAGAAGANGSTGSGAGGGGGAGFVYILYTSLTANSGTITVSGGTGGTAGTNNSVAGSGGASQINNGTIGGNYNGAGTGVGGAGGVGWSSVSINNEFI